jgi:hypothetical protein
MQRSSAEILLTGYIRKKLINFGKVTARYDCLAAFFVRLLRESLSNEDLWFHR